jgi:alkylhydroperoxidase family enzyme
MNTRHAANIQLLIDAVLTSPGETEPAIRRALADQAARLGERTTTKGSEIPSELVGYVSKVALHAYKTTDEDIEALLTSGYSEDAVFEITLCAALGAGLVRWERGLAALKGDK